MSPMAEARGADRGEGVGGKVEAGVVAGTAEGGVAGFVVEVVGGETRAASTVTPWALWMVMA